MVIVSLGDALHSLVGVTPHLQEGLQLATVLQWCIVAAHHAPCSSFASHGLCWLVHYFDRQISRGELAQDVSVDLA